MNKLRVGVARGGPSNEYEVSLKSGANVLAALRRHYEDVYEPCDIFIDRQGTWHMDGIPIRAEDAIRRLDVVFNALHGAYGEDGKLQSFLEVHGLPFTGSGSLGSAIGMNKALAKKAFRDHDIKTPYWKEISSERIVRDSGALAREMFQSLILPVVVKPAGSGSSVGVSIVRSYADLPDALRRAAEHGDAVMIEEFITGIEATAGVVEGFRGQELYALPPIEIRPRTGFFDFEAKYQGTSQEIVPATFSDATKREVEDMARRIHQALGLRHYSRSDFIIHPRRGIYALEANTLPGLTDQSLMPLALRAVGSDTSEFIDHLIRLAVS